jgi:hypothetical protein
MDSVVGDREKALKPTEEVVGIDRERAKSNPAFVPDLATSLGVLGSVRIQENDLQAASEHFREGLAVLLPALLANPQALRPLADRLAQLYFATLQELGQDPDSDLMAAYAAAFADG